MEAVTWMWGADANGMSKTVGIIASGPDLPPTDVRAATDSHLGRDRTIARRHFRADFLEYSYEFSRRIRLAMAACVCHDVYPTLAGCVANLSFPEITGDIKRATSITARAQTLDGEPIEIEATGFLSRAIQHEVDHLNGILFIDRMSSAAKTSLSSKLKRLQKETERGAKQRQRAVAETTL